ncbi:hypothetical protein BH24DEI2_BH24DEI2_23540 [soil metagenome]
MSEASTKGYDRLAPYYRTVEHLVFGRQLMHARTALWDELPPLETVYNLLIRILMNASCIMASLKR